MIGNAGRARGVPGARLLDVTARLVPTTHRDEWRAEWIGEISHAWMARRIAGTADALAAARLRLRCLGATADALWMRGRYGSSTRRTLMLGHDIKFAARTLARRPVFTMTVVATLALCIGANTAVFTIVNSVLRRGLPYSELNRLVAVWSNDTRNQHDRNQVSVGDYRDWRARSKSFSTMAGFFPTWNATYTSADVAERIDVGVVSSNFLSVLGTPPAIGRGFLEGEDQKGAPKTVILSHAFWTRVFNGDSRVIGRSLVLDGELYSIVGVLRSDFTFPQARVDLITPLPLLGSFLDRREVHLLAVVGRLRDGVTLDAAQRELASIAKQIEQEHPKENAGYGVTTLPLATDLLGDVRRPILILFGAVCVVVLIGCVNVGNLMLARMAGRRQELAVRAAMGAEPGTIRRQLMTESALVAFVAGVLGIAVAIGATAGIAKLLPPTIARIGTVRVDGSVLMFTVLVSVAAAILSGLAPAIQATRGTALSALAETARGGSRSRGHRRLQRLLVVSELALALVLTVSAGLLINSFARLTRINPGFSTSGIVKMKVTLTNQAYPQPAQRRNFFSSVIENSRALPGVRAVGAVSRFPLHDSNITTQVAVEGAGLPAGGQYPDADMRMATSDYFAAMGIPLVAGRTFSPNEPADSSALPVAIVNCTAARTIFGTANPIGRRAQFGGNVGPLFTIVGVVGDLSDASLKSTPRPQVYLSSVQAASRALTLVVRYDGALAPILDGVRRAVASADRTLPIYDVQTIEDVLQSANRGDRFTTLMLSAFSFLALVLAALGTYGVIAQSVSERTREIGVRLALGASGADVLTMVLREGLVLLAFALPFAVAGVMLTSRAVSGLLFGVGGNDPTTVTLAAVTLGAVTLVACCLPAVRASRVDPTVAMRAAD